MALHKINFTLRGIKKHTRETCYCPTNVLNTPFAAVRLRPGPRILWQGSSPAQFVLYTICSAKSSCYCNICHCPTSRAFIWTMLKSRFTL